MCDRHGLAVCERECVCMCDRHGLVVCVCERECVCVIGMA